MNINEIEKLNESEVADIAIEKMVIKGFNVYFVNIEGAFGYSYLVFKNNHSIHYANDYELHHGHMVKESGREALRNYYIESINNKLFTDEEIVEPLKDYFDYTAKEYFLRNYHPMQVDRVSFIHIYGDAEEDKAYEKSKKGLHRNPVSFYYMADEDFIKHEVELLNILNQRKSEVTTNFEYQKSAFLHEMYNHEYGINWQADYDTLSAFGTVRWAGESEDSLNKYFDQLGFNDVQRKAYIAARKEYFEKEVA